MYKIQKIFKCNQAIHGFREKEIVKWSEVSEAVLTRIKSVAFVPGTGAGEPMQHVHVLDLASAGYIKPHVDAVKVRSHVFIIKFIYHTFLCKMKQD